jgi:hypothetical protein
VQLNLKLLMLYVNRFAFNTNLCCVSQFADEFKWQAVSTLSLQWIWPSVMNLDLFRGIENFGSLVSQPGVGLF